MTDNLQENSGNTHSGRVDSHDNVPVTVRSSRSDAGVPPASISDEMKLTLLVFAIFLIAIIAFWPLMTVFIWAVAIAVVLLPVHKWLCRRVTPAASATFLTLWVLLIILLVATLAVSVMLANEEHIGDIGVSMVSGLRNSPFAGFVPAFTSHQLDNFDETLKDLIVQALLALTGNTMQTLLSIIIFFLTLSMLLFYGESIWKAMPEALSPKLRDAVNSLAEISENTVYALIIVQISAAMISFILALLFFTVLGKGDVLLFSTLIGFAMLVPLIGAQVMIILLALYFLSIGDTGASLIMLVAGYPLLSGWIDFFYRPVMMGRRVAVHPVIMMIGIFAGVPFMGIVGFIIGPVLIALVVTGAKILSQEYCGPGSMRS
jgi:predicted PurR-regulated permease PerM